MRKFRIAAFVIVSFQIVLFAGPVCRAAGTFAESMSCCEKGRSDVDDSIRDRDSQCCCDHCDVDFGKSPSLNGIHTPETQVWKMNIPSVEPASIAPISILASGNPLHQRKWGYQKFTSKSPPIFILTEAFLI